MNDTVRTYNPFWPVFIVFFFFVVTSILQLISNVQAKNNLQAAVAQLSKGVTQAQAKSAALNGLARDLVDLAPSSAPAQQIVSDFHIQIKGKSDTATNAAPSNAAAPASAPATPAKP